MLVTAADATGEVTVPLGSGFQDLIDRVAMRDGLTDSDAYLAEWGTEEAPARPGTPAEVAGAVARELDGQLEAFRQRHLAGGLGPGP